jgi:hypothetical protein
MTIWSLLISRELLFLALVTALGAAPAAFLGERFGRAARWTMAPALGLCVGACLTVTLVYFYPAHETDWLVVAAAVASVAAAAWHRPPRLTAPRPRSVVQVAAVIIVVLGCCSYPLALRGTVGPIGGYQIADTAGYVSEIAGEQADSMQQAQRIRPPYVNLALAAFGAYAGGYQQLDVSALEANLNSLVGLGPDDTQAAFLSAVLLVGALGVFAVVRAAGERAGWAAAAAGCMFAGPLFMQLVMEGSEAAICGSAVLAPLAALGIEATRRRSAANLILLGLAAAGLQTLYPLFVPCVVIGAAVVLAALGARALPALRARTLRPSSLARAAGALAVVLGLSMALTPVAFARNASYWIKILHGQVVYAGLPPYDLPFPVLPGWLLQTREFYGLIDVARQATTGQLIMAVLVPLLLLGVIALAVARDRIAFAMLAAAGGAALLAYYTWQSQHCGYCVQRNLLPIGSLAATGLGLGLVALAALNRRPALWAAAAIGLALTLIVAHEGIVERQRMIHGDYMLDTSDRRALAALPAGAGPVDMEGYSQGEQAPMELPLVYDLIGEVTHGRVSIPTSTDDGRGLFYLIGTTAPIGPSFDPWYRYVLTRLGGVATARTVIARDGPIALERRTAALDVTLVGGVGEANARADRSGTAWVNPALPLRFLVVGARTARPAWVLLALRATVPVHVVPGPGLIAHERHGDALAICLKAAGTGPVRTASVRVLYTPQPAPAQPSPYDLPEPDRGLSLAGMRVSSTGCGPLPLAH